MRASIRFIKKTELKELIELYKLPSVFEKSDYNTAGKEVELDHHLFKENASLYFLIVTSQNNINGNQVLKGCMFYIKPCEL